MNRAPESRQDPSAGFAEILAASMSRFGVCLLVGLTGLGAVRTAWASDAQISSPSADQIEQTFPEYATVEELLRLDAQAALLAARRSVTNPLDAQRPLHAVPQGNALLAIFGTDRALNAEVQIGSRVYTYRSARRGAVSGGASP